MHGYLTLRIIKCRLKRFLYVQNYYIVLEGKNYDGFYMWLKIEFISFEGTNQYVY